MWISVWISVWVAVWIAVWIECTFGLDTHAYKTPICGFLLPQILPKGISVAVMEKPLPKPVYILLASAWCPQVQRPRTKPDKVGKKRAVQSLTRDTEVHRRMV